MKDQKKISSGSKIHDRFVKKLLSDFKEFPLDVFRLVFTPSEFRLFRWDTIKTKTNTYVTENYEEKLTDAVFSVSLKNNKTANIVLLIEHKSYQQSQDREEGLLMQLLQYQAAIYSQNSGPIIPIVIYHGRRKDWKEPKTFQDSLRGLTPRNAP